MTTTARCFPIAAHHSTITAGCFPFTRHHSRVTAHCFSSTCDHSTAMARHSPSSRRDSRTSRPAEMDFFAIRRQSGLPSRIIGPFELGPAAESFVLVDSSSIRRARILNSHNFSELFIKPVTTSMDPWIDHTPREAIPPRGGYASDVDRNTQVRNARSAS